MQTFPVLDESIAEDFQLHVSEWPASITNGDCMQAHAQQGSFTAFVLIIQLSISLLPKSRLVVSKTVTCDVLRGGHGWGLGKREEMPEGMSSHACELMELRSGVGHRRA